MSRKITKAHQEEIDGYKKLLRKWCCPGKTVYTVLHHVSSSGMTRHISLYVILRDKDHGTYIRSISGFAAEVMGDRRAKGGGIVVGGCGMDMGFHLVYNLGQTLYPSGGPRSKSVRRCFKGEKDDDREPSGGYLLRHEWL